MSNRLNIISKLTLKRIKNFYLLKSSYKLSKITKKVKINALPAAISIEPTTACNLGCPECPSGLKKFTRNTGNLKLEMNKKIIDELHQHLIYINYYFQGEPYINPLFLEMVSYAHSKNIYTATSTNAHFLDEVNAEKTVMSGLDQLIISIDGVTQETYEKYRINGHLQKVFNGTQNIIQAKKKFKSKTPYVIFQFLVVAPNEHEIEQAKILAKQMGVDEIRFKTAQLYDFKNGNALMPANEKYSRYILQKDGTYRLKNKLENACWRMWSSCVITWDGKIVPCCFDKDAHHQLGELSKTAFNEIWFSDKYNQFRQQIITNRGSIEICKNCSEGTKIWA